MIRNFTLLLVTLTLSIAPLQAQYDDIAVQYAGLAQSGIRVGQSSYTVLQNIDPDSGVAFSQINNDFLRTIITITGGAGVGTQTVLPDDGPEALFLGTGFSGPEGGVTQISVRHEGLAVGTHTVNVTDGVESDTYDIVVSPALPRRQWPTVMDSLGTNGFQVGDHIEFVHRVEAGNTWYVRYLNPQKVSAEITVPGASNTFPLSPDGTIVLFAAFNEILDVEISLTALEVGLVESEYQKGFSDPFVDYPFSVIGNLPVELTDFSASARQKQVQLNFTTASETQNAAFHIEHAPDGVNWQTIGRVAGSGTTTTVQEYTFTHADPVAGDNYYRLRQEDFDGTIEYSPVRQVTFSPAVAALTVFPNPATEEVTISSSLDATAPYELRDVTGRAVRQIPAAATSFSVAELPTGVYLLRRVGETEVVRLVVR